MRSYPTLQREHKSCVVKLVHFSSGRRDAVGKQSFGNGHRANNSLLGWYSSGTRQKPCNDFSVDSLAAPERQSAPRLQMRHFQLNLLVSVSFKYSKNGVQSSVVGQGGFSHAVAPCVVALLDILAAGHNLHSVSLLSS